jgi:hypothetical protein
VALAIPHGANAGPVEDVINGVQNSVSETVGSLSGGGGSVGGSAAPAPAPAPAPAAGVPPTYTPPLHGTNPHGQGTVGVIDVMPEDTEPLPYDPDGGSEDVVVGRARGEQNGEKYRGHITIVSTFLTGELVGVDTNEGETEAGPLEPFQENVLDALCAGSGGQICLEVLRADSKTTKNGSKNSFAVANARIGGPTGISATAAESNGNISEDSECQTAHGDSTVTEASIGGALTADVLESESDSTACNDGTETVKQDGRVVELNETGLPVPPEPGCEDGTPNSNFVPLVPLLAAVCNAEDINGAQTSDPYGVREALSLFVLDVGGVPLLKTTTAAAESHAVAPGGPECPDPDNPDCPPIDECPDPDNPDCPNGGPDCPDADNPDCPDGPNGGPRGPDDDGPSAKRGPREDLPFTGADLGVLGLIGAIVMAAGLSLMALSDRRRRAERG